ncbi:hypothetical protein BGZ63DRAFT_180865 [Mariannaea sp. PMI_226]|nr:hypothetical protein BGZ63DRAFT_180865 [Mariannaea sp. PMI_226]
MGATDKKYITWAWLVRCCQCCECTHRLFSHWRGPKGTCSPNHYDGSTDYKGAYWELMTHSSNATPSFWAMFSFLQSHMACCSQGLPKMTTPCTTTIIVRSSGSGIALLLHVPRWCSRVLPLLKRTKKDKKRERARDRKRIERSD